MNSDFVFLCEQEKMWAEMLMQVLTDQKIPCLSFPVYGVGLIMRTGMRERLKIYVPKEKKIQADMMVEELFSQGVSGGDLK